MLSVKTVSERHVLHVFSHMWQVVSKDVKRKLSAGMRRVGGETGRAPPMVTVGEYDQRLLYVYMEMVHSSMLIKMEGKKNQPNNSQAYR